MSDEELTRLLERAADELPVGDVPLGAVHARAGRRTRRRAAIAVLASAAAVAAAIAGAFALTTGESKQSPPIRQLDTGLVGVNHVTVEVPRSWATVHAKCGSSTRNSVVLPVGHGLGLVCPQAPPRGITWVAIAHGVPRPHRVDHNFTIQGVAAQRDDIACFGLSRRSLLQGFAGCRTHVYIPSEQVTVTIMTATDRAVINQVVHRIRVLPGYTSVPDFADLDTNYQQPAEYVARVLNAGFRVVRKTEREAGAEPGSLLRVTPRVGSMVRPGSTVTITTVLDPRPPERQVTLAVGTRGPHADVALGDAEIRSGASLTMSLAQDIQLTVSGPRQGDVRVVVDSSMLMGVDHGGFFGAGDTEYEWAPRRSGRTRMEIELLLRGKPVTIGTIEVTITP